MSKALVFGLCAMALSAGTASAQGYGYGYGYDNGYAAPVADLAAPAYGYAAPAYGYGAVAPAQAGSTIIIVTPAPAYTAPQVYAAPPVTTGYYAASAVSQPLYNYAPGYGYGYTPGYWNRGYWGRYYR